MASTRRCPVSIQDIAARDFQRTGNLVPAQFEMFTRLLSLPWRERADLGQQFAGHVLEHSIAAPPDDVGRHLKSSALLDRVQNSADI
jgi:hypothetical protein